MKDHRFILASDHAAIEYKKALKARLEAEGAMAVDINENAETTGNYVLWAGKAVEAYFEMQDGMTNLGILICGTGMGMCVAANRHKGIYAGILYDDFAAEYAKRHLNLNFLVFGARTMTLEDAVRRIHIFCQAGYEGGKYAERNKYLDV